MRNHGTIYFIVLLFAAFFSASSLFSQEPMLDFELDIQEEQAGTEKETLYIKSADQINYSQQPNEVGYNNAVLYGNVYVVYEDKHIYADKMQIKFFKDKVKEITASGNVMVETKDNILIGEKLFFYPDDKIGLIYEAETYNKPYFIMGDYFKFLDKQRLIAKDMTFSSCEYQLPHYSIGASKGWIYKDDKDYFLGFNIRAGQDPIFYFPFMYRSYYGTGLITSLGKENGVGWFLNNTYKTTGQGYSFKFMLDHYQKIGDFVGVEYSRTDIGNLTVKTSGAYDRHVKYESGQFINYFIETDDPDDEPVSGRSLRFKLDLDYNKEWTLTDWWKLKIGGKYKEFSDPHLTSQFESRRMETFDMQGLLFPKDSPSSLAGSPGNQGSDNRFYDFFVDMTIAETQVSVKGSWQYVMNRTDDPDASLNKYKPEYYKNYLSTVIFPQITVSRTFSLFDPFSKTPSSQAVVPAAEPAKTGEGENKTGEGGEPPKTVDAPVTSPVTSPSESLETKINITWPMRLITDGALTKTLTYASASSKLSSEKLEAKGNMTLDWPLTYTNQEIFEFRFPFKITGSLNWEDYEYDMQLASSTSREIKNLIFNPDVPFVFKFFLDKYTSIELPLYLTSANSFKWSEQDDSAGKSTVYTQNNSYSLNNGNNIVFATRDKDDTLSFQNSVPIGYTFGINKQTTSPDSGNDSPSNYKTASYRLGNTATLNFLKNYEYLAGSINASYAFSNSTKFDTEPSYLSDVSSHNYNFELSILKSKLSFSSSTSETFKPTYSITKNPYDVSFSTTLLPYFELGNAYRYSRKDSKAMSNTLTIKGSTTKTPATSQSTATATTTTASTTTDPASPNNPLTVDSPIPTQTKRTGNEIYITDNFWINSFNFNLTWSRDYYAPQNDRMNYDFTMNLNLGEDWIFDMGFRGRNSQLYKYTAKYREDIPTAEHREFFDDLVDSLQFWKSVKERQRPYFKMESFVFNIKHFLHKWVMELQTTFTPRQDATTKAFYFESQILFKLTLTELPSLNPPEVKKTFGKQPTN